MLSTAVSCGRPVVAFTASRSKQQQQSVSSRGAVRCNAEEPKKAETQQQQQQPQAVPPPPTPPTPPPREQFDYTDAPDALGPVGNVLMAGLLIALCGASIFFTVGRQFQDDMVPLVAEEYAQMMADSQKQ